MSVFRRKPRTLDQFKAGWSDILNMYSVGQEPSTVPLKINFCVTPEAARWVKYEAQAVNSEGNVGGAVYAMALCMGVFRLYCSRSGQRWEPALISRDGQARNLPEAQLLHTTYATRPVALRAPRDIWNADAWAYFKCRSASRDQLVDSGLRVLGALALMPEGSIIGVRGENQSFGLMPLFNISGADPYPAGLANEFMPPQPLS